MISTIERIDWQGITVEIRYTSNWLNLTDALIAHLEIESVSPQKAPLPITETGYKSHFLPPPAVAEAGGPVAYVREWLEEAACDPAWIEQQEAARQMTLF